MLKDPHRGREYRMDAAQDCLTPCLCCVWWPPAGSRRDSTALLCTDCWPDLTALSGLPRAEQVDFKESFTTRMLGQGRISVRTGFGFSHKLNSFEHFLKHTSGLEGNDVVNSSFVETLCISFDLSAESLPCPVPQPVVKRWKCRGKLSAAQLTFPQGKQKWVKHFSSLP